MRESKGEVEGPPGVKRRVMDWHATRQQRRSVWGRRLTRKEGTAAGVPRSMRKFKNIQSIRPSENGKWQLSWSLGGPEQ